MDFRWEKAQSMLEALTSGVDLSPYYAGDILEAVHLKTITSYTLYSNVLDLKENRIYLNYMAQFNEIAVIDMEEEFKKGQRVVEMRDFFSQETAGAGDAAYQHFATRFLLVKIGVILTGLILMIGIVYLIIRTYRKHKK